MMLGNNRSLFRDIEPTKRVAFSLTPLSVLVLAGVEIASQFTPSLKK